MAKKKKQNIFGAHRSLVLILAGACAFSLLFLAWARYDTQPRKQKIPPMPNHTIPYVDSKAAAEQVENFYHQYRAHKDNPDFQKDIVEAFGNKSLAFYYEYYQHGFDPVVCSTAMPHRVTVYPVSGGTHATVNVIAEYPDGTTSTIETTVILDVGVEINSITCPGGKGNLPPAA